MAELPVETKRTYCRICIVHCGLTAEVQGEQILKVKGDFDHPLTQGYTCPKGRATGQVHHLPTAITRPLMQGADGALAPVSWDEALDDIGAKLRRIIDEHGPNSVGIYFGSGLGLDSSGYVLEEAFYKALGTPPKFTPLTNDATAKVMMAGAMGGFYGLNPKTDYNDVEMLLYVGTNPMVSHAHNTGMFNPAHFIRAAAARGEVWTIDPVLTETAKWSTRHIAAYPGKDYAILAWLVREIIDGGPLKPAQKIQGLGELRAALEGWDRAKAAAAAEVSEQELDDLLAAIRRKGRVAVETGTGITMSAGANLTQWFAWLIMILTGSMNQKGGAWLHPGFIVPFDSFELPVMESAFTKGSNVRPDILGVLDDWPCAVLPLEIEAGNIRALFNFGGSMLRSFPDTNALKAALPKLALHVNTEIVENDLTPYCTHVLPTKDAVERDEFTRWDTLAWNLSLQYTPALVKPMGERRSAWWVISQFMKRAGLPVPDHVPDSDLEPGADERMLAQQLQTARCSFEELKAQRYVERPLEFPAPWVDAHFERMGGWRLAPAELVGQWAQMRAADEAWGAAPKPLCYTSRRQRKKFNAQLSFLGEPADILLHPDDAAAYGIRDGQKVRVRNKNGAIVLVARVDAQIRRGVCSIPHGHETANVNFLTSTDDIQPWGGMAFYSGVPIEIEPVATQGADGDEVLTAAE
ncbi:molybdopterin-dependent oxidoreductase [Phenylobacterium sp. LjRoot225]|uniref:molybdopterin-containing oxidoreductase family protein n=1 Tax=Phenylobacterium sp. LjRoot225 TaxID=3342285 RepID=UPI003ECC3ACF